MAASLSRRSWLKKSTLLAGGSAILPSVWNELSANPGMHKMMTTRSFTEEHIARMAPPELKARLFANENPFGPSDKAKAAIHEALASSYQYPFRYEDALIEKYTSAFGLPKENFISGAGSSALLYAAALRYGRGGEIITGDPSYDDLAERAEFFGAGIKKVPLTKDYKLDLAAMEKAITGKTTLVYICNPNNPTATTLDTAELMDFCDRVSAKVPVFVDEAYIHYLPDPESHSMIPLIKKGKNVIVARTFSKLYGFAGLRMGFAIAQPEVIKELEPCNAGLFCLSATSLNAAIAAFDDKEFLDGALQKTMASKDFLYKTLEKQGYKYIPSDTNFVMFPIKMDGKRFTQEMMKRGVGVRFWDFNKQSWCRVSIGRMDEMEAFADAFSEIS